MEKRLGKKDKLRKLGTKVFCDLKSILTPGSGSDFRIP
jgi:hypothetical protein